MISTLMAFAMIIFLMAAWYVAHSIMQMIVAEYGILGGLVACGAIYASSLVMDHYDS